MKSMNTQAVIVVITPAGELIRAGEIPPVEVSQYMEQGYTVKVVPYSKYEKNKLYSKWED